MNFYKEMTKMIFFQPSSQRRNRSGKLADLNRIEEHNAMHRWNADER